MGSMTVDLEELVNLFSCYAIDFMDDEQVDSLKEEWFCKFQSQCKVPLKPILKRLNDVEDHNRVLEKRLKLMLDTIQFVSLSSRPLDYVAAWEVLERIAKGED